MKTIGAKLLALAVLLFPSARAAGADGWVGGMTLTRLNVSGQATFGTTTQPADTCNYFGYYFKFDATTPEGRNMYATLLAAKLSGQTVAIWYTSSPARGTDQTNGCVGAAMATVTQVAVE